jgi:hypothetical protein
LREGEAAEGLLEVNPTAHAGFDAALDLVDGFLVDGPVFLGQPGELAVTQHVEVGAGGFVGDLVGGAEELEIAHGAGVAQALDVALGGEAVEDQLAQLELVAGAVIGADRADGGVAALAAGVALEVDPRKEPAAGDIPLGIGGLVVVEPGHDFRVAQDRLFDSVGQGAGRRGLS